VKRVDAHTLHLELLGGAMFKTSFERLYRRDENPLRVGERVELKSFSATILEVDGAGHPRRMAFKFDRALDEPGLRLFAWHDKQLKPVSLADGESALYRWQRPF
jgi:hypothetical protein